MKNLSGIFPGNLQRKFIMNNPESVPFNIWDDYHDDGFVPLGKSQDTYGYVEEHDFFTEEDKIRIVATIADYINKNLDITGTTVKTAGADIEFYNLTHMRREKLVKELQDAKLTYNNFPIQIYSES